MASDFRAPGDMEIKIIFEAQLWGFLMFKTENLFLKKKQIHIYSEFDCLPGEAFIASVISMELCQITWAGYLLQAILQSQTAATW